MLPVKLFLVSVDVVAVEELDEVPAVLPACAPLWSVDCEDDWEEDDDGLACDPLWSAGCDCEDDGLALVESGNVFGVAGGFAAGDCAVGSCGCDGDVDPWPKANGIKQATSAATNNSALNFMIFFSP